MADDIGHWLEKLKLGEYAKILAENQVDLDAARDLTEADLTELGIPMGPRKKLLRAIGEEFAGPVLDADRLTNIHATLSHASKWGKFHAELRMKHFNLFIIVSAALIASANSYPNIILIVSGAGIMMSIFSFILDKRYLNLIQYARDECYRLEPMISSKLHEKDKQSGEMSRLREVFTTTFAYRFLQALSFAFWMVQMVGWPQIILLGTGK